MLIQESDEIVSLHEITKSIHAPLDLTKSLSKVLDLLSEYFDMNRMYITFPNHNTP